MTHPCPCCLSQKVKLLKNINGYNYYQCLNCHSLYIDVQYLKKIDEGFNIVKYEETYWREELFGFTTHAIPGKTWAYALEYSGKNSHAKEDIRDRIWTALDHNLNILTDSQMGSVLRTLGLDTARAYR